MVYCLSIMAHFQFQPPVSPMFFAKKIGNLANEHETWQNPGKIYRNLGLFSLFCWEQGFDKVCESSRTLKLFEGFDVSFWETGPWAPPPTFKSFQLVVYFL